MPSEELEFVRDLIASMRLAGMSLAEQRNADPATIHGDLRGLPPTLIQVSNSVITAVCGACWSPVGGHL